MRRQDIGEGRGCADDVVGLYRSNHCEKLTESHEGGRFMPANQTPEWRGLVATEIADQLAHIASELCWCDPNIEVDENGDDVVIHRKVIWN